MSRLNKEASNDTKVRSFFNKLEWSPWIWLLPLTVLLLPFISIFCFILVLLGFDVTSWLEGSMFFIWWIVIFFGIIQLSTLGFVTFLFHNIDKSFLELHKKKGTQNVDEITSSLGRIQRNMNYFRMSRYLFQILLSESGYRESIRELKNELIFSIDFIRNMELQLRETIQSQKYILEWAKNQIEQNMNGASEFRAIWDIQKERLHKQLIAFQKLQIKLSQKDSD